MGQAAGEAMAGAPSVFGVFFGFAGKSDPMLMQQDRQRGDSNPCGQSPMDF